MSNRSPYLWHRQPLLPFLSLFFPNLVGNCSMFVAMPPPNQSLPPFLFSDNAIIINYVEQYNICDTVAPTHTMDTKPLTQW